MIRRLLPTLAVALLIPACSSNSSGRGTPPPPPPPAPGAFSLSLPSNGLVNEALLPFFRWTASVGASTYELQVASDSGFATVVLDQPGITALLFTATTPLSTSTTYWWRVWAINAGGQTLATGSPRSFTTVPPPPGPFTLLDPADGEAFVGWTPTLAWSAAPGAVTYNVQVSLASDFSSFIVNGTAIPGLTMTFGTTLLPNTTYYWQVFAVNPGGSTPAGPRSFTTKPVLGSVASFPGTLKALVYDSSRNRVYLSNDTSGTVEIYDVATSSFLVPVAVGAGPRGLDLTPDLSRLLVCMSGAANIAVVNLTASPPVVERTVSLPPSFPGEMAIPNTLATAANGLAFVGFANAFTPLRQIDLSTWVATLRSDCTPDTSGVGPAFGVNAGRTVLAVSDVGLSGGSWWYYTTTSNAFSVRTFDDGTSSSAAVDAGGTFISFSGRILDSTGLSHANWSDGSWLGLFHPDGHRLFRTYQGSAAINVIDLATYTDLDDFSVPSLLNGPAVLDGTGATLFAIASNGLLVLPLTPNRPPVLEPIGPFIVPVGRSASTRVIARDPEGSPVTLSTSALPANATFDPSTGFLTFSPVSAQAGQDYVVFVQASDGSLTTMTRADLVVPATGSPAITLIPISGALGKLSFDSTRNRLYVANSDRNRIETLDLGTLGRLAPIPVGDYPVGIDLNLSASRLVVCPFGSEFIEVVDLTAVPPARVLQAAVPNTTPINFKRPWETGVAANGEALFASKYPGSGTTGVWDLTLSSGTVVVRSDVPDTNSQVAAPANFAASRDRLRVFIGGGSSSSGSMHRYDSATNSFLAKVDTNRFFDQLSTNQDGSKLSMTTTPGIVSPARVYDGSVAFLGQVSQASASSAFSPDSGRLYWTSRVTSELVASETAGFTDLFRMTLPATPVGVTWPNSGGIAVNPAGDRVLVIVQGGIAIVEVTP